MGLQDVYRCFTNVLSSEEDNPQPSSCIIGEEDEINSGDEDFMTDVSLATGWKRKRVRSNRPKPNKTKKCEKPRQGSRFKKKKQEKTKNYINRWSTERYERAEMCMLEIMKSNNALVGNKISRPALRSVARKHIGDTGLLDHLLKHMDSKVAPGGVERFRRCYNPDGVMEYWLESADLVNLRHEVGEKDPYWIPPPMMKIEELKLLNGKMLKTRGDVDGLMPKERWEDQADMIPVSSTVNADSKLDGSPPLLSQGTMLVWKAKTEQRLTEFFNSLCTLKDMHNELEKWKGTVENQLREISNALSMKRNDISPWLGSSDMMQFEQDELARWLDHADLKMEGDDFASWLVGNDTFNMEAEVAQDLCTVKINHCGMEDTSVSGMEDTSVVKIEDEFIQDPYVVKVDDAVAEKPFTAKIEDGLVPDPCIASALDEFGNENPAKCVDKLGLLGDDLVKTRRNLLVTAPSQAHDDKAFSTLNSSVVHRSMLDLDRSLQTMQEMYEGSMKWKAKIEQQIMEISSSLGSFRAGV